MTATEGQAYSCKNAAKLLYVAFVLTGSIAKKTCSPVKPYLGIRKSQRRKPREARKPERGPSGLRSNVERHEICVESFGSEKQ